MDQVRDTEAKERFELLLDRVEQGEEIIITRDGKPVARLVQAEPDFDRAAALQAAEQIQELSKGQNLQGLSIKDLINEGRKY